MANALAANLKKLVASITALFVEKELVEGQLTSFQKFVHFWILVGRGFINNRGVIRAAALTYTTLLALVPMLAIAVSISSAVLQTEEGHRQIQGAIDAVIQRAAPQLGLIEVDEGERHRVGQVIHTSIQEIHSGTLGAISMAFLILVAISLLGTIESTMNDIWGIHRGRGFFSRLVLYWAVITLGPILLVVALGLSATPHFETTQQWLSYLPLLAELVYLFLPLLVFILFFAAFFKLMPNTRVTWRAALLGAAVTGLLLYLNNTFSQLYFVQVVKQHRIYGSLGILPVFLIGLYLSWIMVLLGGQVAYTFQNRHAYFQEIEAESVNERGREFVALRLMTLVARCFHRGERPPTAARISETLGVSARLVRKVIEPLLATKLLVEVQAGEAAYAPARPLDQISYFNIIEALRAGEGRELATFPDPEREQVRLQFERIRNAERQVGAAITLAQAVRQEISPKQFDPPHSA